MTSPSYPAARRVGPAPPGRGRSSRRRDRQGTGTALAAWTDCAAWLQARQPTSSRRNRPTSANGPSVRSCDPRRRALPGVLRQVALHLQALPVEHLPLVVRDGEACQPIVDRSQGAGGSTVLGDGEEHVLHLLGLLRRRHVGRGEGHARGDGGSRSGRVFPLSADGKVRGVQSDFEPLVSEDEQAVGAPGRRGRWTGPPPPAGATAVRGRPAPARARTPRPALPRAASMSVATLS